MIKAKGVNSAGRPVMVLGLEEENLKRLRDDSPILILAEELELPFDLVIYYGQTLADLEQMMAHAVTKDTVIVDTRRRKKQ